MCGPASSNITGSFQSQPSTGGGYRNYPGISQDCPSYFGVGYSDMGGCWIQGLSQDIPGLSELLWCRILWHGGILDTRTIHGYPGNVRVTLVYRDTLTWGGGGVDTVTIPGYSGTVSVTWNCETDSEQCMASLDMCDMFLPGMTINNYVIIVGPSKGLAIIYYVINVWKVAGALWSLKGITSKFK